MDSRAVRPLEIAVLPGFLKTDIDRQNFSFTHFLRTIEG